MVTMSKEIVSICATATKLSITPYSIEASKTAGIGIAHCAWVNGVHVCR
jgi:hypothetical protein